LTTELDLLAAGQKAITYAHSMTLFAMMLEFSSMREGTLNQPLERMSLEMDISMEGNQSGIKTSQLAKWMTTIRRCLPS